MSKTVLIAIDASDGKLVELTDGTFGLQLQVSDAEAERLRASALVAFVEGDDWKNAPDEWKTADDSPRHEVFGHPLKRVVVAAPVELEPIQ